MAVLGTVGPWGSGLAMAAEAGRANATVGASSRPLLLVLHSAPPAGSQTTDNPEADRAAHAQAWRDIAVRLSADVLVLALPGEAGTSPLHRTFGLGVEPMQVVLLDPSGMVRARGRGMGDANPEGAVAQALRTLMADSAKSALADPAPTKSFLAPPTEAPQRAAVLQSPPSSILALPDLDAVTLAGVAVGAPLGASVVVLARSREDAAALVKTLQRLQKAGGCAGACIGLVAMGDPWPSRAIEAGRLRARVEDTAMHARIAPVFESAAMLFARFGADPAQALAVVETPEGR